MPTIYSFPTIAEAAAFAASAYGYDATLAESHLAHYGTLRVTCAAELVVADPAVVRETARIRRDALASFDAEFLARTGA
jgi:hypothetical protein